MDTEKFIDTDTVSLCDDESAVIIIDQTKLPSAFVTKSLRTQKEIWDAIYKLEVRGAPAIGVTAGMAYYLAAKEHIKECPDISFVKLKEKLLQNKQYLSSSRPTAVNLFWALSRMENVFQSLEGQSNAAILTTLKNECLSIRNEDIEVCRKIGENGLSLIKDGDGILTHCNAGKLAAVKYGTATSPIYLACEKGYKIKVYSDETRPLLQGARLTSFELSACNIDVTVLCDSMSASLMQKGLINIIFVGADRVAANGDTANKIGTLTLACAAKQFGVPFYVCAPSSTVDTDCKTGKDIPIEQRKAEEVTEMWYKERMAPQDVKVYNPAFDVTPAELITGIVTEFGIFNPKDISKIK